MAYVKKLSFEEKPDYNYLRNMFKDLFRKSGFEYDYNYDWTKFDEFKKGKDDYEVTVQKSSK